MSAEAAAPQLPGDSSCGDKEFAVEVLEPDHVPQLPVRLSEHDFSFRHTTVCHCLRGVPDADLLREALQRVLTKNPVVAGRLRPSFGAESTWQPEGLEISFDGPLGVHFQVRPMSAELEAEVESLTGERCAQEFLHVHTELAEALGVGRVAFALDLIGRDRPLCVATYTPGKRVSVVALSLSRLFGEAAALNDLLRRWDEEFAAPNSTAPLSGGTCEPDEGGEVVMRMLCKPLYALQAVTQVLDGARHWLYELGCRGVAGCCADRPVTSGPDHAKIAAPGQHLDGRSLKERKPQVEDDSAPEDREFYAIAVRVREETLTSFRAAAAASAPPGDSASAGSPVEALGAWLGNVLRAPRLLVSARNSDDHGGLFRGGSFAGCAPEGGPGHFHARDIRRALDSSPSASIASGSDAFENTSGSSRLDDDVYMELLSEVQYFPHFGTRAHYLAFELHDLWQRTPRHVVARCNEREYLAFHCVCQRDKALALQRSWRHLGESALGVASEAQLQQALERL